MDSNRMGRYLCLILRHKPETIGIQLDPHGWADVQELLQGVNRTRSLTMAQLEEIVRTDEKMRYSFNENKTRIRANQGHSIPVDVELEEIQPPDLLWHGTSWRFVNAIQGQGLLPQSRLYVHLSGDRDTAIKVGQRHGAPVLYRVASGQMAADGVSFFRSRNGVWLTRAVPQKYLELEEV